MTRGNFGGGDGSEENPFLIEDAQDLRAVGIKLREYPYYCFKLKRSIDLQNEEWTPIGDSSIGPPLMGVFDGDNKTVSNISINNTKEGALLGFFSQCVYGAVLKNIRLANVTIVSNAPGCSVGSLTSVLANDCVAQDCSAINVKIEAVGEDTVAGGLIATASPDTRIERCSVEVEIQSGNVGGFVYSNYQCDIRDCYAIGSVDGANKKIQFAPFVCQLYGGSISNCYTTVGLRNFDTYTSYIGTFAAFNYYNIEKNSSFADITTGVTSQDWELNKQYSEHVFIRGTDGELYDCIYYQHDVDLTFWDPSWSTENPPGFWNGPYTRAQPTTGAIWDKHWKLVTKKDYPEVRDHDEMIEAGTYVGWDFQNVWTIKEGQTPTLLRRSTAKLQAMPLKSITVVS